ncbi:unnamed protein product, partial [Penicillium bialowiezense]
MTLILIKPDFPFSAAVIGTTEDDLRSMYRKLQQSVHAETGAGNSPTSRGEIDENHIFLLELIEISGIE